MFHENIQINKQVQIFLGIKSFTCPAIAKGTKASYRKPRIISLVSCLGFKHRRQLHRRLYIHLAGLQMSSDLWASKFPDAQPGPYPMSKREKRENEGEREREGEEGERRGRKREGVESWSSWASKF